MIVAAAAAVLGGEGWPSDVSAVGALSAIASGVLYYAAASWFCLTALRTVPSSFGATSDLAAPPVSGARLEPGDVA